MVDIGQGALRYVNLEGMGFERQALDWLAECQLIFRSP